jgi:CDP-diacylglycerol--glycerol-3-phosphate 3-phosphatidyltransferase
MAATPSFGPSALATPANAITIGRVVLTPLFLALVIGTAPSYGATGLWILLAGTDGLDGYLARKQGTTRSGAFLDPLADKFLVLGSLFALVVADTLPLLPVALIALREVVISAYRSWVGRRGISLPARPLAKVKTVVQLIAIGFALLPPTAEDARWVPLGVLWVAVALTLASGAQYLIDGTKAQETLDAV